MGSGVLVLFGLASYMVCVSSMSSMSYSEIQSPSAEQSQAEAFDILLPEKREDSQSVTTIEPNAVVKREDSQAVTTVEPYAVVKRATNLVIEASFVFDKKALQGYINIGQARSMSEAKTLAKTDLDFMLSEMNMMYETLNLGLTIGRRNVLFLNRDLHSGYDTVSAGTSLSSFRQYLKSDSIQKNLNYDIAILLTGYDLTSNGHKGVAGYADVGGVCLSGKKGRTVGTGAGVVEMAGNYQSILVAAHEIGHIMGCKHDTKADGHIMNPSTSLESSNKWAFSYESRQYVQKFIAELESWNTNCMKTTNPQTVIPSNIRVPTGISTPDGVCKRTHGRESFHCKFEGTTSGDGACKIIYCDIGDSGGRCTSALSSEGMNCGKGKACIKGKCKESENNKPSPNNKVNGGWGAWGNGGQCDKSCGGGQKTRSRACNNPSPSNGGSYCSGSGTKTISCNTQSCPVDACNDVDPNCNLYLGYCNNNRWVKTNCKKSCGMCNKVSSVNGNWGAWNEGQCSKSCGGGLKTRSRSCNNPSPTPGGLDCKGNRISHTTYQSQGIQTSCNTQSCSGNACKDVISNCIQYLNNCNGSNGWKEWMTRNCKKSCGKC